MTTVAELFGLLGIQTDTRSFLVASDALRRLKEDTDRATMTAELSAAITHVAGDAKKAAALIGVNYDEAGLKAEQAKKRTEAWGKAMAVWGRLSRTAVYAVGVAFGALASLRGLGSIGDEYTGAASKIRGMTEDVAQQQRLQDQLYQSAQLTATGYGEVAGLYQQVGKAATTNGRTLEDAASIVDTINKGIKASGATAAGSSAALTQLAQALGSGRLRGEEFNSVIEQAPFLIDVIGKSLGKNRGELRKMAEAGQLTSKVVLRAFEQQKGAVDDAFAKRLPQIGDLFTRLRNRASKELALMFARKDVAEGLRSIFDGLSTALVGVIQGLASVAGFLARHPDLTKAILVVVVALTAAYIAMGVAAGAAWIAALGPVALVAAGVMAVIAALVLFRDKALKVLAVVAFPLTGLVGLIIAFRGHLRDIARLAVRAFGGIGSAIRAVVEPVFVWFKAKYDWLKGKVDWIVDKYQQVKGAVFGTEEGKAQWQALMRPGASTGAPITAAAQSPRAGTTNITQTQTINAPVTVNAQTNATADHIGKAVGDHISGAARGARKTVGR